jgi:phenylpropionate dioxygenase-like ring-hydroxylating dioxygenase large terminal subunit
MILFLLLIVSSNGYLLNHWYPISPYKNFDYSNPQKINVLDKELVVWKKNDKIIVQDNNCIHRKAPLSEGYIDKNSKNLRCSYHGWEFNEQGWVTCMPQCNKNLMRRIEKYDTMIYGNMLWVNFGNKTSITPDKLYNLNNDTDVLMRDLPYDVDILLENLFDPAHIPFAHHKLQSTRELASPVNINTTILNTTQLSFNFEDWSNLNSDKDHYRNGTMNFILPCYYYLETLYPDIDLKKLNVFCTPIEPGKTKLFISYQFKEGPFYQIYKLIPKWTVHLLIQTFFDSDTYILNRQEKWLRKNNNNNLDNTERLYYMPTTSDKAVQIFNKWKRSYFHKSISIDDNKFKHEERKEILDRYYQHTKHCIYCSTALENFKKTQTLGSIIILSVGIYEHSILTPFLAYIWFTLFEKIIQQFIFKDYVHKDID